LNHCWDGAKFNLRGCKFFTSNHKDLCTEGLLGILVGKQHVPPRRSPGPSLSQPLIPTKSHETIEQWGSPKGLCWVLQTPTASGQPLNRTHHSVFAQDLHQVLLTLHYNQISIPCAELTSSTLQRWRICSLQPLLLKLGRFGRGTGCMTPSSPTSEVWDPGDTMSPATCTPRWGRAATHRVTMPLPGEFSSLSPRLHKMSTFLNIALVLPNSWLTPARKSEPRSLISQQLNARMPGVPGGHAASRAQPAPV